MRNKIAIAAGAAVTCLAAVGAAAAVGTVGVPAVMAGIHTPPGPVAIPRDWPAAKAAGLREEDRLRAAAAGRPMVPPGSLDFGGLQRQAGQSSRSGQSSRGGQDAAASFTPGVVPLTAGGPFRPGQFLGTNLWNGPVRGRWEVVQAGGVPTDRARGAASPTRAGVFVYTRSANPADPAPPHVLGAITPPGGPAGKFTITKVQGHVLSLSLTRDTGDGTYGRTYHFDTARRRFRG